MSKPGTRPSVWDLPRNDIEACRRYWLVHEITGEEWRTMIRLQDDPGELLAAAKTWRRGSRSVRGT